MDLKQSKEKMNGALEHFKSELNKVRTGRALPSLVEDINVQAYGSSQPLKGLASISTPSAREIMISPWDKGVLADITKALETSDLGINPVNTGEQIKLTMPELSTERREELIKVVNKQAEEARISLRNAREEFLHAIKEKVDKKEVGEDQLEHGKKEIQKIIDDFNQKVEELVAAKHEQIRNI